MIIVIFSIEHYFISAYYHLPKLGNGDASKKTGVIFEEHDLRKTMSHRPIMDT